MTRDDKILAINRWTRSFYIERSAVGEYYACVTFHKEIHSFYADQYPSRCDLIDDSYSRIKLLVWQFVKNELCDS